MKYEDLTINQKIQIKGAIESDGASIGIKDNIFAILKGIWILFDFKTAVTHFLDKIVNPE